MSGYKPTTSLYGRRFGLQALSSAQTGARRIPVDFLVGDNLGGFRQELQTATSDTTGTNIKGWGITSVDTTTDDTWLLDNPIKGVTKMIWTGSTSTGIRTIKRKDSTFAIQSSAASTLTTIIAQGGGLMLTLLGLSSALYCVISRPTGFSSACSTEMALNGTT